MRASLTLFFLSCVLFCSTASAQLLGLSPGTLVGPDTVWHNTTHSFEVVVANFDSMAVTGTINLNYGYEQQQTVVPVGSVALTSNSLNFGDTVHANFDITFSSAVGYEPGGNIVVIWPEAPNADNDTLTHGVYVRGQVDSVGVFKAPNSLYPPVFYKDTSMAYAIRNTGSTAWSEPLTLDVRFAFWDDGTQSIIANIDTQTPVNAGQLTAGQDDIGFYDLTHAQLVAQGDGGNTIVIWPEAPSHPQVVVTDSAFFEILVAPVGLPEEEQLRERQLFPNPSSSIVQLWVNGQRAIAKELTITDFNGRMIETLSNTDRVDLTDYSRGVYFINVRFADDLTKSFKVVRL